VHFCDDYFQGTGGELTNYQMFKAILEARGELMGRGPESEEENFTYRDATF
jgi:hypothetical protein